MISELTDKHLFEAWKKGNDKAFEKLFNQHFSRLFRFASANLRKDCDAEELVMDLFYSIWKRRETIEMPGDIEAYLYKSLRNRIIDQYRKRSYLSIEVNSLEDKLSIPACDTEILSRELEDMYSNTLNKLSPQRKLVYELSRIEGKTYAEIADSLNLSVNTVENHISASLRFIRSRLRESGITVSLLLAAYFRM